MAQSTPHGPTEEFVVDLDATIPERSIITGDLNFERVSIEDGLSQSSVLSIVQDRKGFMWFATLDGLNKYDGYQFNIYKPDEHSFNSISHRYIVSIMEDIEGALWIGTDGGGLNRYDRNTGEFTSFRYQAGDPYTISSDFITAVYEDSSGTLWVGTNEGLNRFDRNLGYFSRYPADPLNPMSLSSDQVLAIFEDSTGVLWVGTDLGGLNRFDQETETFSHYRHDPSDPYSLGSDTVRCIYEDRRNQLWVGTAGGGLNRFNRSKGNFQRYSRDLVDPFGLSSDDITAIYEDSLGTFWIGTYGGGLLNFEPSSGSFIHYRHNPSDPKTLSSDYVLAIYEDRTGVLWIGTNGGGLNKVERLMPRFQGVGVDSQDDGAGRGGLNNEIVRAIHVDQDGVIWIGTNGGGLNRWEPASDSWIYYRHDPNDRSSLSDDVIHAIAQDGDGYIWIGTERGGLDRFNPNSGRFNHYQQNEDDPDSLSDNNVQGLYVDKQDRLWVGTRNGGLDRFDRDTGKFIHYYPHDYEIERSTDPNVRAIYEDSDGVLWYGVGNSGLYSFDTLTDRITGFEVSSDIKQPSQYIVMAIQEDHDGILWIGTFGDGLLRFDRKNNQLSRYTEVNGLANNIVYGILEDNSGQLWLSTNNGLSKFDPLRKIFTNYDVDDGLLSREFSPGAFGNDGNGRMYFGGIHGFNYFYPEDIGEGNPYKPSVVLTSLTHGGTALNEDHALENTHEITLLWPVDGFEFEFVGLSYIRSDKNQYAYKLEGFDDDWVNIGTKRYGRYTNLPGGNYRLRLKASNNDGVWNDAGVTLGVTIVPPVWEMWWFQGGLAILVIGSIVAGYRWRVRSVEAHSRKLETEVSDRTLQLSTMNRLLENEINERKRIEDELAEQAAESAVAAERSRLARELHDAVTQTLFSASLIAEALPVVWEHNPQEGQELLDELRNLSRGALAEMRTLLLELRPAVLVEASLEDLLRQLSEAAMGREGIPVKVDVQGKATLPCDVHIAFYRVAQEALNNVLKHARATNVEIDLIYSPNMKDDQDTNEFESVTLKIRDDGRGFEPDTVPSDHMGLVIMQERAQSIGADFEVNTKFGKGTNIQLRWYHNRQEATGEI